MQSLPKLVRLRARRSAVQPCAPLDQLRHQEQPGPPVPFRQVATPVTSLVRQRRKELTDDCDFVREQDQM